MTRPSRKCAKARDKIVAQPPPADLTEEEHRQWHRKRKARSLTPEEHKKLTKGLGVSDEQDRTWHKTRLRSSPLSHGAPYPQERRPGAPMMSKALETTSGDYFPLVMGTLRMIVFRSITAVTLLGSMGTVLSATTHSFIVTLRAHRVARSMWMSPL
jgi:hypothetical protein